MPEAGSAASPVTWSETEAAAFAERLAAERLVIARQRFTGADPAVRGPSGSRADRTIAKVLAADRDGAFLQTGAGLINPAEDRAEEALQHASAALGSWGFTTVQRELTVAAATARTPDRQQRIGLIRALTGLVRAIVYTAPGDRLRGEERSARSLIQQADQLPDEERQHYQSEVDRLLAAWREAASEDNAWQAWAILRGRLALRDGADESTLAWALRAWQRQPAATHRPVEPNLANLLDQTRAFFAALAAAPIADMDTAVPAAPRARDVLTAVATALAAAQALTEPFASTLRFSFIPFHPPRPAAEHEVAT